MNDSDSSTPAPLGVPPRRPHSALDWAQREGAADEVLDALRTLSLARRRRKRRLIGAACTLAAAFAIALVAVRVSDALALRRDALATAPPALAAATAEQGVPRAADARAADLSGEEAEPAGRVAIVSSNERQHLPDGSLVELREGAELVPEFTDSVRRVLLRSGTAHFAVVPDAGRPFEVVAQGLSIRAVGTAFCVDLSQESVEVLVTEGRVSVSEDREALLSGPARSAPDSEPGSGEHGTAAPTPDSSRAAGAFVAPTRHVMLAAGERVRVQIATGAPQLEVQPIAPAEWEAKLGWRVPRLEFSRARLGELLPEFNRYAARRIVLADPELAELRISGTLRADRSAALLEMLRRNFDLRIEERGDSEVVVSRR
ncbi:hypothetical protein AXK11_06930 [Cephaloticoccus primus]|uniref:FecR protein domain-containing protein n=1 Tax=Cephaloticoccus primus TaxID=1548207 RepID=A0A139SKJ6_9BACT|nr:FecR domain-containing protein [Cephaloticoccus primus]KXU35082.1 hypothetical protein AXK11_06930 [Cephaloticoccus primus]